MACSFTYNGKEYDQDGLVEALRKMTPVEAAKYIPGIQPLMEAPFKTTWSDLGLKRMLHRAATERNADGTYKYDALSWTPGEEQNKRYPDRGYKEEAGMEKFYNEILPNKASQLVKKHGAKVEKSEVSIPNDEYREPFRTSMGDWAVDNVRFKDYEKALAYTKEQAATKTKLHVIKMTPQLRAAAEKGLPLFKDGGAVASRASGGKVGGVKIDRSHDVKWLTVKSLDGKTIYKDRSVKRFIQNNGKQLDTDKPLIAHENAEFDEMRKQVDTFKKQHGREPNNSERRTIYLSAHKTKGTAAEEKWLRDNGFSVPQWMAWCRGELARLEKKKAQKNPPSEDVCLFPHGQQLGTTLRASGGRINFADGGDPEDIEPIASSITAPAEDSQRAAMRPFIPRHDPIIPEGDTRPSLTEYHPSIRDRLARALLGDNPSLAREQFVQGAIGSRGLGNTGMSLADLTPAGIPMAMEEAARAHDPAALTMAVAPPVAGPAKALRGALSHELPEVTARATEEGLPSPGELPGGQRQLEAPRVAAAEAEQAAEEPLEGLPSKVNVPGHGSVDVGPFPTARRVAREYMEEAGLPYEPVKTYSKVDEPRARRIAQAFEDMEHNPDDPEVRASYNQMVKETLDQWRNIKKSGLQVEFIPPGSPDPYDASPRLATEDIRRNNHLWVFPTDSGYGESAITKEEEAKNPLLQKTGEFISGQEARANDIFRIVHDYFGHAKESVGFRAPGEENAWRSHAAMYSPLARKAMTTETRGQNSWLNYGPHGEANRGAKTANTVFADQKIGLLPDWVMEEGRLDPGNEVHHLSYELDPGAGAPYNQMFPNWSKLKPEQRTDISRNILPKIVDFAKDITGANESARVEGLGGWHEFTNPAFKSSIISSPEIAEDMADIIGYLGQQTKIFGYKPNSGGNKLGVALYNERLTNPDISDKLWNEIVKSHPDLAAGFSPSVDASGTHGIEILLDNGGSAGLRQQQELIPAVNKAAKKLGIDAKAKDFRADELSREHDWEKDPTGGDYTQRLRSRYGPNIINKLDRFKQQELEPALRQEIGKYSDVTHPAWIDQRLPTSKKDVATGEPLKADLESMKASPKLYEHNVGLTKDYPNTPEENYKLSTDDQAESFINHAKNNILWLHDQIPPEIRERSKLWYEGGRKIIDRWSKEFGLKDSAISGVMAALSPQMDWFQNVSLARRVLEINTRLKDLAMTPEMVKTVRSIPSLNSAANRPIFDLIKGKRLNDIDKMSNIPVEERAVLKAMWTRLYDESHNSKDYRIVTPEGEFGDYATTKGGGQREKMKWNSLTAIAKAIRSVEENGSQPKMNVLMGMKHKIRNFYNNLLVPNSTRGDVTVDTHAVAAGLLRPLAGEDLEVNHNFRSYAGKDMPQSKGSAISGIQGTYPLYAEAYRRAAADRNILPREIQSITWEGVRGLFPEDMKNAKFSALIDGIWNDYRTGKASLDETRSKVLEAAGGIRQPKWASTGRPAAEPNAQGRGANNPSELPESGLSGETTPLTRPRSGSAQRPKVAGTGKYYPKAENRDERDYLARSHIELAFREAGMQMPAEDSPILKRMVDIVGRGGAGVDPFDAYERAIMEDHNAEPAATATPKTSKQKQQTKKSIPPPDDADVPFASGGAVVARASGGRVLPHYINHSPSEAQKSAGNYKKFHTRVHGLEIAIENAKGSKRSGVGKDGKPWSVVMPSHYGDIKKTTGSDLDNVDVYLGPHHASKKAFIIDQRDADTGKHDEFKTFLCFGSVNQVKNTFLKAFSDGKGKQRLGNITEMPIDDFKNWLKNGNASKVFKSQILNAKHQHIVA